MNTDGSRPSLACEILNCPVVEVIREGLAAGKGLDEIANLDNGVSNGSEIEAKGVTATELKNCGPLVAWQVEALDRAKAATDTLSRFKHTPGNEEVLKQQIYYQGPEPFNGNPKLAKILVLGSNPAFNIRDNIRFGDQNKKPEYSASTAYPKMRMDRDSIKPCGDSGQPSGDSGQPCGDSSKTCGNNVTSFFEKRLGMQRYYQNQMLYKTLEKEHYLVHSLSETRASRSGGSRYVRIIAQVVGNILPELECNIPDDTKPKVSDDTKPKVSDDTKPKVSPEQLQEYPVLISEIVHCKSFSESAGVDSAAKSCKPRWLHALMRETINLKVIILCGATARELFDSELSNPPKKSRWGYVGMYKFKGATPGDVQGEVKNIPVFAIPHPSASISKETWDDTVNEIRDHLKSQQPK